MVRLAVAGEVLPQIVVQEGTVDGRATQVQIGRGPQHQVQGQVGMILIIIMLAVDLQVVCLGHPMVVIEVEEEAVVVGLAVGMKEEEVVLVGAGTMVGGEV